MCTCFLDGGVSGVSSQGVAPPPPSCRSLQRPYWNAGCGEGKQEQATRAAERGVGQERERKKKPTHTHTNFNYAFIYHRNKGLFTGQQQRVLPGKSTQLLQLTRGTSQCKWWCVNGAVLKAQEKYGMRVAYHLTWLALAVSSHSV